MSFEIRTCGSLAELRDGINAISHYFGGETSDEDAERFAKWMDVDRMHIAVEDDRIVAGAGAFTFRLSVPGGSIPAGGVTVVGVLPSHRRRGILRALMRDQLDDCRRRGETAAYLWASEGTIYGRFGYGLASRIGALTLSRDRAQFAQPFEPHGVVRIVSPEEAAEAFPPIYDQVYVQRPGMFERTAAWWETRRLYDEPSRRGGAGPLNRVLLELDGSPAGYAMYRVKQEWEDGYSKGQVRIVEAVAATPEATRELWRWLFDFDWTSEFSADLLPLDHPLFLLLAEPRRMRMRLNDGVWLRLLDVEQALSARTYAGDGEIVLDVTDGFLPDVAGRYRVTPEGTERTDAAADLRLDVTGLGSTYLGAFSFGDLVRGLRAEELTESAARRADALFATGVEPWCAEIF
jgi:predicted acetyltransferase